MRRVAELVNATGDAAAAAFGAVRRVAITLTSSVLWQWTGVRMPDGGQEVRNAEPFTGIGTYARPPGNGKPEAILVMVGRDGNTPVIVAVRDQATRAAILNALGGIQPDESLLHNSKSVVYVKADGTIEARSANGAAAALALEADLANVGSLLAAMYQPAHVAGTPALAAAAMATAFLTWAAANPTWVSTPPTAPIGTTILKGQ